MAATGEPTPAHTAEIGKLSHDLRVILATHEVPWYIQHQLASKGLHSTERFVERFADKADVGARMADVLTLREPDGCTAEYLDSAGLSLKIAYAHAKIAHDHYMAIGLTLELAQFRASFNSPVLQKFKLSRGIH